MEIFWSPLHLVFFDGDWKVYCILAFKYLWWDLYFSWNLCHYLQEGDFTWAFLQGFLNLFVWHRFYQGSSYGFILSFLCRLFSFLLMHQIWYCWCFLCRREGASASLGKSICIEYSSKSPQIDREGIDNQHQGIYKVIQVRSTGLFFFSWFQSIGFFILLSKPELKISEKLYGSNRSIN